MSEVLENSCQGCDSLAQENELLRQQLRATLRELSDLRARFDSFVVESKNIVNRVGRLKETETTQCHVLCKAKKRLESMKKANAVGLELEAKRMEMEKCDLEEKRIDLELLRMRNK